MVRIRAPGLRTDGCSCTSRAGPTLKQIFLRSAVLQPFPNIITPNLKSYRISLVTHVDIAVQKPIRNRHKLVQWMTLILGVNIP